MKPSLPRAWFDLCIVPEHDGAGPLQNQLVTRGVLNTIRPGGEHSDEVGLAVIGGPSRHYQWDDDALVRQLEQLVRVRPKRRWWLTSSRRTPVTLPGRLADELPGMEFVPFPKASADWLAKRLAEAGEVWVTEDSVSMIYEALSSGARVGLLEVPRQRSSRVTQGVDRLIREGWVGAPGKVQLAEGPGQVLNEAGRCAQWINEQWLNAR
jgi:mitochondrial fission protein ELM1